MFRYIDLYDESIIDILETIGHIVTSWPSDSDLEVAAELLCHLQCRIAKAAGVSNVGHQLDINALKAMWNIK